MKLWTISRGDVIALHSSADAALAAAAHTFEECIELPGGIFLNLYSLVP